MAEEDEGPRFGAQLRALRMAKGWSGETLATKLREEQPGATWTQQTVSNWEHGPNLPKHRAVITILDNLLEAQGELEAFAGRETDYVKSMAARLDDLEKRQEQMQRDLRSAARRQAKTQRAIQAVLDELRGDEAFRPPSRDGS